MTEEAKQCVLIFDEINIQKGLNYSGHADTVVGYVDLGEEGRSPEIASQGLVFMLKGVYNSWKMPIAYYLTSKVDAATLTKLLPRAINSCEMAGMRIRVVVADGAPPNRSAFKRLGTTLDSPFIHHNGRRIYVMTDPVHLLKAPRNNLLTQLRGQWLCNRIETHKRFL